MSKMIKFSLLAILLISSAFAQYEEDPNMLFGDFGERNLNAEEGGERLLAASKIRITNDYTYLTEGSEEFLNYAKVELIPAVTSYLQAAISVKYPLTSPITVTKATLCGRATPQALLDGADTDLYVIYNSKATTGSWVATATSCMVSTGVKRPIIITIGLNANNMRVPNIVDSPLSHDVNINTLTHEYVHGLGLNGVYFNYFVDSKGNALTGHVKKVTLSGKVRTVLDLPPLTTRLRNFVGCTTIPGYFLSDNGSAHPDERFFRWDIMVNGASTGSKISQFTLGFLEGTGWYSIDYNYAEPYFFGQGQGCTFYGEGLAASELEEYCTGTGRGCTNMGDSGGYCTGSTDLEGYKVITAQPLMNCDNIKGVYYTRLANMQVYGRGLGSKCFTGNLTTSKTQAATPMTYCLTYKCSGSGTSTKLALTFGTTKVTCTKKGPITVTGYSGQIDCPDPIAYCKTIGKPACLRNCMGRGKCVSGKCTCNSGFQGTDCGFTA